MKTFVSAVSRACCFLQKNANRIHLLNMSYGEHAHFPNGRIGELIRDTIDKYGITWCGSAGNHGPAVRNSIFFYLKNQF